MLCYAVLHYAILYAMIRTVGRKVTGDFLEQQMQVFFMGEDQ